MRATVVVFAAFATLAVAACGAGSPTIVPRTLSENAERAAPREAFAYAGKSIQRDAYTYPSPKPQPSTKSVTTIARTVQIASTSNPFGSGTVLDYASVENDATVFAQTTLTADAYYAFRDGPRQQFVLYGSKSVDDQGNATSTRYHRPQIVDRIVERKGQHWTNAPGATIEQRTSDGNVYRRKIENDGSYIERDVLYGVNGKKNFPAVDAFYSDAANGAATFSLTYQFGGLSGRPNARRVDAVGYGVATGGKIAVTFEQHFVPNPPATPGPSPSPVVVLQAPAWFSGPLYKETDVDVGRMRVPDDCKFRLVKRAMANQIVRTVTQIDAALGTIDVATMTQYNVDGYGVVCAQTADVTQAFYDYNQDWDDPQWDPPYLWFFLGFSTSASVPLQTTTFSETITLQSIPKSGSARLSRGEIAAAWMRLDRRRLEEKNRRLHALIQNIERLDARQGRLL